MRFCRGGGIRTPGTLRFNGFQDRRIRPLCHSSVLHQSLPREPCGPTVLPKAYRRISQRDGLAATALPPLYQWSLEGVQK